MGRLSCVGCKHLDLFPRTWGGIYGCRKFQPNGRPVAVGDVTMNGEQMRGPFPLQADCYEEDDGKSLGGDRPQTDGGETLQ